MKRDLLLFTGFGFLGLNLIKNLKNKKYKIKIFGKKKKFLFKIKFSKSINYVKGDFFNLRKLDNIKISNSTIILTTLNNNNKNFIKNFKKFVEYLSKKNPKKVILISSVGVYGNNKKGKISILNQYAKNSFEAENVCKKNFENLIILRAANIFGVLRPKPGLIEKVTLQYLNIKRFNFFKYETLRTYISVDEFCKILKIFINIKTKNSIKTYNISNNKLVFRLSEILKLYENFYNRKINVLRNNKTPKIKVSNIKCSKLPKKFKFITLKSFFNEIKKLDKFYKNCMMKKKIII